MMPLKLIGCVLPTNFAAPPPPPRSVLPGVAFGKGAFGVFSTVPIRVSCGVDAFKAYPRGRFRTYTQAQKSVFEAHFLLFISILNEAVTGERLIYLPPTG